MSTCNEVDTSSQPRRRYSDSYRRQVVAETWRGAESVSEVARRHDLNTNLLFKWRRRYPSVSPSTGASAALIPIHPTSPTDVAKPPPRADVPAGRLIVTLASGHRLTLEGRPDPALVRVVLETLG